MAEGIDLSKGAVGAEYDWSKVMKPYPGRKVILPNGEEMIIEQASKDQINEIVDALLINVTHHKDLFDLVTSEIITELYWWRENRPIAGLHPDSHFILVGRVKGEIVGVTNGGLIDPKTGMSLHTVVRRDRRGLQIGAYLWPAKLEMWFDVLGCEKVYAPPESAIGMRKLFRPWGFQLQSFPEQKHPGFYTPIALLTKEEWERLKPAKLVGELLKK